jgi:hypothetical protein
LSANPVEALETLRGRVENKYKMAAKALADLRQTVRGLFDDGVAMARSAGTYVNEGIKNSLPTFRLDPQASLGAIKDLGRPFADVGSRGSAQASAYGTNALKFGEGVWKQLPEFNGSTVADLSILTSLASIRDQIGKLPRIKDVFDTVTDWTNHWGDVADKLLKDGLDALAKLDPTKHATSGATPFTKSVSNFIGGVEKLAKAWPQIPRAIQDLAQVDLNSDNVVVEGLPKAQSIEELKSQFKDRLGKIVDQMIQHVSQQSASECQKQLAR